MFRFALEQRGPVAIRYPKTTLEMVNRPGGRIAPIERGKAEVLEWGEDACFIACGTLLSHCQKAAKELKAEGLHVGVINARFIKPLDVESILKAVENCTVVVTVEENTTEGGFGSAVLEACAANGVDARHVIRRGIPDRFIEHGDRNELLTALGLDADSLADLVRIRVAEERRLSREAFTSS
jgi:1-deoxy-D-xylulose-5-phosphate synthase